MHAGEHTLPPALHPLKMNSAKAAPMRRPAPDAAAARGVWSVVVRGRVDGALEVEVAEPGRSRCKGLRVFISTRRSNSLSQFSTWSLHQSLTSVAYVAGNLARASPEFNASHRCHTGGSATAVVVDPAASPHPMHRCVVAPSLCAVRPSLPLPLRPVCVRACVASLVARGRHAPTRELGQQGW